MAHATDEGYAFIYYDISIIIKLDSPSSMINVLKFTVLTPTILALANVDDSLCFQASMGPSFVKGFKSARQSDDVSIYGTDLAAVITFTPAIPIRKLRCFYLFLTNVDSSIEYNFDKVMHAEENYSEEYEGTTMWAGSSLYDVDLFPAGGGVLNRVTSVGLEPLKIAWLGIVMGAINA